MSRVTKFGSGALAIAVLVAALLAVSVSSAAAAVHWSDTTHGMKPSGTLTVYHNGKEPKTCTAGLVGGSYLESNIAWVYTNTEQSQYWMGCSGTNGLGFCFLAEAGSAAGGGYQLTFQPCGEILSSPWGASLNWGAGPAGKPVGKFTNGSGATPSKVSFSGTQLGVLADGSTVSATGTLNITTSTGGLITLLP